MGIDDQLIQEVRDEHARMRAHLFEMIEAMGLPETQESGAKGLVRSITYSSQASVEAALRRRNGRTADR